MSEEEIIFIGDSAAIVSSALGSVSNATTRVGGQFDPNRNIVLNRIRDLSIEESRVLLRNSNLLQEAVTAYPVDAYRLPPEWNLKDTNIESGDISDYFENLVFTDIADQKFKGRDGFKEAQVVANKEGNAYIVLDIDEGFGVGIESFDDKAKLLEPIDLTRVKSVIGGAIFGRDRCNYTKSITLNSSKLSGVYLISSDKGTFYVHKSRVIKFDGSHLTGDELYLNSFKNPSRLQAIYNKFCNMEMRSSAVDNYIQTASTFVQKMKGLAEMATQKKEADLRARFELTVKMISSVGGFFIDADREEVGFVNRNFGGLDALLRIPEEQFIAATGVTKGRLYKTSNQGAMSESGKSDQVQWAGLVANYQSDTVTPKLRQIGDIIVAAQDFNKGTGIVSYTISYCSILTRTEEEKAITYKTIAEGDKVYKEMGLKAKTIIDSRFSGAEYGSSITLGEDYMEEEPMPEELATPPTDTTQPVEDAIVESDKGKLQLPYYEMPLSDIDYEEILQSLNNE